MKNKKWWIYLIIAIVVILIVICIFGGFTKNEEKNNSKNITVNDLFVNSILKTEYRSGIGEIKSETQDTGYDVYNKTTTTWDVDSTVFVFTDTPYNVGGNFGGWSKELKISSTDNKFFNIDKFSFLKCTSFEYSNISLDYEPSPFYRISIEVTNETKVNIRSNRPTAKHIPGIDEVIVYLKDIPENCTA
jgi:hypothetical protein